MTTIPAVLATLNDALLRDEVDRVAAAVGVDVVHLSARTPVARRAWTAAVAVLLDEVAAECCAAAQLPRRPAVTLLAPSRPDRADLAPRTYRAALGIGAAQVLELPGQAAELVTALSVAGELARPGAERPGAVIAVIGGRGGAGASLFACALAQRAAEALLIDVDPWGGGLDLLLGSEAAPGVRWPDLAVRGGRLEWSAVQSGLPRHGRVAILSGARHGFEIDGGAVESVIEAGRRGGATVVCDLPRSRTDAAEAALATAELVVLLVVGEVRCCAAAAAMVPHLTSLNPNVGLVVRGPAPGGLTAADVAAAAGLPVLATMRPEPLIAERLERTGLRLSGRSPLRQAADEVLRLLGARHPGPVRRGRTAA